MYIGSTAVYCTDTHIYTAFSLLQLPHGIATQPHNHSCHGQFQCIYMYMYIYMSFSQTVFIWQITLYHLCLCAPLLLCKCSIAATQHTPAHEGTRLRSTREYTATQHTRVHARTGPAMRRQSSGGVSQLADSLHSETSPADPNPTATELIAPPSPHCH
jgi:hypothetical protein